MEEKSLILCDSDILIELIDRDNKQLFDKAVRLGFSNLCVSSISFSELIFGANNKTHLSKLLKELDKFILCELTPDIDKIHRDLMVKYSLSHGLKMQDALIAATAIFYQIPLFTFNISDFRFLSEVQLVK